VVSLDTKLCFKGAGWRVDAAVHDAAVGFGGSLCDISSSFEDSGDDLIFGEFPGYCGADDASTDDDYLVVSHLKVA